MDPDGEWLTSKSDFGNWDDSFILEKDTLDLIKPEDTKRMSSTLKRQNQMIFEDEKETKLDAEVDEEWQKFLSEARGEYNINDKASYAKFKSRKNEEART